MTNDRAWVTGVIGGEQYGRETHPLVCVRRLGYDKWELAIVRGSLDVRAAFRQWLGLMAPLHCTYNAASRTWLLSAHAMAEIARWKHPFALLINDARRAIAEGQR